MFTRDQPKSKLEEEIDSALNVLSAHTKHSEEYAKIVDQVVKLHKMKEEEKPSTVSPDTLLMVAANLIGILMITKHERADIITSKALSFVMKPR